MFRAGCQPSRRDSRRFFIEANRPAIHRLLIPWLEGGWLLSLRGFFLCRQALPEGLPPDARARSATSL